jgi:hypothetical protein
MLYLANRSTSEVIATMIDGRLGMIATPRQRLAVPDGVTWAADTGCYSATGYPGDRKWLEWLTRFTPEQRSRCLFATAPDVVADAAATLARSDPYLDEIHLLGFCPALVLQDGLELLEEEIPWDRIGAVFIGGSTRYKIGDHARRMARLARDRGLHVHMGRVNSLRRMRYAEAIGCQSVDGTLLVFGPDVNLPRLLAYRTELNDQRALDIELP